MYSSLPIHIMIGSKETARVWKISKCLNEFTIHKYSEILLNIGISTDSVEIIALSYKKLIVFSVHKSVHEQKIGRLWPSSRPDQTN